MTDKPTDGDGHIVALLMLSGGVALRDAARLLGVQPTQIRGWMAKDGKPETECD